MRKSLRIGNIDAFVRISRMQSVDGMCSNLEDGRHILMWDFDDVEFSLMRMELQRIQVKYALPEVTIFETKEDRNYMAYCFVAVTWKHALEIVLDTDLVCWNFWRLSVSRGYFTLRMSEKDGRRPRWRATIPGVIRPDVAIDDLVHAVRYETRKGR